MARELALCLRPALPARVRARVRARGGLRVRGRDGALPARADLPSFLGP